MYQNRPSKSHQLQIDQGVQMQIRTYLVIPPRTPANVSEPIGAPSMAKACYDYVQM